MTNHENRSRPQRHGSLRAASAVDEEMAGSRRRGGARNPRGSLETLDGPFILRQGLDGPGRYATEQAMADAFVAWARQVSEGRVSSDYVKACVRDVRGFVGFAARHGAGEVSGVSPNLVRAWMNMPKPSGDPYGDQTLYQRRSSIRAWFETLRVLGICDTNPALSVSLPARQSRVLAPAIDEQIPLMRARSQRRINDTTTPVLLALSLSCATPGEQVSIDILDVDVANRRVWVDDKGYRQNARWLPLFDDWCAQMVFKRIEVVRAATPGSLAGVPLLSGRFGDRLTAKMVGKRIKDLAAFSGADRLGEVRVEALREWAALKVWQETASVETVAHRLGMASLDAAAHVVGHQWMEHRDGPPPHRR